jgi:hypothetical protein
LTFEAAITYPFHPLVGQMLLVVGDHEHDGIHYYLVRQPHGGSYQVPDWMFSPDASTAAIVAIPRLPVSQLMLLRTLVDSLIACPLEKRYPGGLGYEAVASRANGSVRLTGPTAGADQLRASESDSPVADAADGGGDKSGRRSGKWRRAGVRQ